MRLTTDLILWSSILRISSCMRASRAHSFHVNKPERSALLCHRDTKPDRKSRCCCRSSTNPNQPSNAKCAWRFCMANINLRMRRLFLTKHSQPRHAEDRQRRFMRITMPRWRCSIIRLKRSATSVKPAKQHRCHVLHALDRCLCFRRAMVTTILLLSFCRVST